MVYKKGDFQKYTCFKAWLCEVTHLFCHFIVTFTTVLVRIPRQEVFIFNYKFQGVCPFCFRLYRRFDLQRSTFPACSNLNLTFRGQGLTFNVSHRDLSRSLVSFLMSL